MKEYVKEMRARPLDIEADKLVAILNIKDSKEFGLFPLDRVEIYCPKSKKRTVCVVDVTKTMVPEGAIGMFRDVQRLLNVKACGKVKVKVVAAPESVRFIKKKLDGHSLNEKELKAIVKDLNNNMLSDVEAAAFISAVYIHDFDLQEIVAMTRALVGQGQKLSFKKKPILDKHCIGGTNGRSTMLIVPIVAAAGFYIPKTSSRSITSAAGTADSMEVLANVSLSAKEMVKITEKHGGVIAWGGALELAPVDDKIIKIEHPFSLDPPGQIIASVMAKKASAGAKYLVIDMPIGPDVKIQSVEKAENMAENFIAVGKKLGIKVEVIITDGTEPSGRAFGPSLEAKHVMEILEGKRFDNLAQKSCELAGVLFEMVGKVKKGKGTHYAKEILLSGDALKKMQAIIKAQGKRALRSEDIKEAPFKKIIKAPQSGEIGKITLKGCAQLAKLAGAPANKLAGLVLFKEEGDRVEKGESLFEIHAENKRKLALATDYALKENPIQMERVVLRKFK